jgi:hypothetical protein
MGRGGKRTCPLIMMTEVNQMTLQRPKQSQSERDRFESIIAEFKRDNAALRQRVAELEAKSVEKWIPLKSADRGTHSYNTVRRWAVDGVITSKHVGGRVFVDANNLAEFLAMRSNITRG